MNIYKPEKKNIIIEPDFDMIIFLELWTNTKMISILHLPVH